ncbi:MAG: Ig-like domain-containing protein [Spirochaetaceae bacterium]|jgi:hypothetical protein|nr:Ig-like domain-containing protein [Spirochaetaceae bacterium]
MKQSMVLMLLLLSCDILRSSPFEIAGWSPGEGYHDPNSGAAVSVWFSREPDKSSVERSFEYSEDGVKLGGRFSWANEKMTFTPSSPPRYGCDYAVAVNTDAEDTEGISLERRFEGRWTTRPLEGRPAITATIPGDNGVIEPGRTKVAVGFSTFVPVNAFNNHVSFNPQMKGSWTVEYTPSGRAVFTPDTAWQRGTVYKMTVAATFENAAGKTLGADFVSRFTVGIETVAPALTGVTALDENGVPVEHGGGDWTLSEIPAENAGWETGYQLLFRFSEKVDVLSFKKAVSVVPSLSFVVDTAGTSQGFSDEAFLSFTERPAFEQRYLVNVESGVKDEAGNESTAPASFRLYVNGKKSKPPALTRIEVQSGGSSCGFGLGDNFNNLQITSDDEAVITLWFDTAEGAEVNLYSLMECFGFSSTNNAASFQAASIAYGDAAEGESCPAVITGALTNKAIEHGVITISVGAGLVDTYGNKQEKAQRVVLLK